MEKTVIITGAAGNLGQSMVRTFLEAEYKVVGILAPNDKADHLPQDDNFFIVGADLTNEENTAEIINSLTNKYGTIEVGILTVGGFAMGSIIETSIEDIGNQIRLNFNTAYSIVRPLFKQMLAQGKGRIFLVGSGPGHNMNKSKGMTAYGLSKSLLFRLAELLNDEAEGKDIITQVIVPSTIDTAQNRKSMPDADFSKWVKPEFIAKETLRSLNDISENKLIIF